MKILFLTRRFWPDIGGVEKHCLKVGKRLVKMGHEVTVVSESSTSEESRSLPRHHPRCLKAYYIPVRASEKFKKFQIWWWLWKNRRLIEKADVVHCHDVFFWYLPFRFLYPRKKVFTTFHGYEPPGPPSFKQIFQHRLAGWLSRGCIAIGKSHEKWYGVKADFVSYGAVEEDKTNKTDRTNRKNKTKNYDFCFVGRLANDNGIMDYLETLRLLKNKGRNFSIVICGDGIQRREAEEFSQKNGIKAEFKGFVEDVDSYLKISRYAFVSRYLGILEAMNEKRFVFAIYDNEIKKDYLTGAPFSQWIVIEKESKDLAERVMFFIRNKKERDKKIEDGFKWVSKQTWEEVTNLYLKLWKSGEKGFLPADSAGRNDKNKVGRTRSYSAVSS